MEDKPVTVNNLESPVLTIRCIFILSWIVAVLVPFPFLNFIFQSANSGNRTQLENIMLSQLSTPQSLTFAMLTSAFQNTLLIAFAVLLLRALAHFLAAATGLNQNVELTRDI